MSYASAVVVLTGLPKQSVLHGREVVYVPGQIPSNQEPIACALRAYTDGPLGGLLLSKNAGDRLLASGDVLLDEDLPVIQAVVCCPATSEQYLNEVVLVGRIGSEPRVSEKSTKRSIALNRYRANPDGGDPIEETDWFGCRVFGKSQERFSNASVGSLVEVSGCFTQMKNAKGEPYAEVKVRNWRVHKAKPLNNNPAAGSSAIGYEQSAFEGDDLQPNW